MGRFRGSIGQQGGAPARWLPCLAQALLRSLRLGLPVLIVGSLAACATVSLPVATAPPSTMAPAPGALADDSAPLPVPIRRENSLWSPVRWADLPGWGQDRLSEAWNAWVRGCARPAPGQAELCAEVRSLSIAGQTEKQAWLVRRLQPYRVSALDGSVPTGLLTGYYEPILLASRVRQGLFQYPLYRLPPGIQPGQPWFSREEIETNAQARAALHGLEIAWLADPIDAMLLHIQGSGRLLIQQDGRTVQTVRAAFAGTNNHPFRSINHWLTRQGVAVTPWPAATRSWVEQNPQQVQTLLWSNPRYVFFREEALSEFDAQFGPRGAQGVPLTPGRSIAVDPRSIPYGTPVWLATQGSAIELQRLVLAQDTGNAIVGSVRADYFVGWGEDALASAAAIKQPLQLWVLWPR